VKTAYIVGISVPVEEFRARLAEVPGAELVQELPHARVVVVLESRSAVKALAAVDGVTAIREDRPERLTQWPADPPGGSAPPASTPGPN
jgi:hypothetical protein